MSSPSTLNLKVEFGGGLELLFNNQRVHSVTLPSPTLTPSSLTPSTPSDPTTTPTPTTPTLANLISHLATNLLTDRPELFIEKSKDGESVRPGILVLVNDTDWELEGEGAYELKDGDEVVFISTLHGG